MINTIDLHEKNIIEEKTRKQIINILIIKTGLDKSFGGKNFEDLNGNELEYLFSVFERNYDQIRKYFKSEDMIFPVNFDEFKKIPLGICRKNIKDSKFHLLDILAKNKKSEFLRYMNPEKFLYIQSESCDSTRNYILSRTNNLENLAKSLNKLNNQQIKTLWFIIKKISNEKTILNFIKTVGLELWTCLDIDPEIIYFFLKNLEENSIKLFFDINTFWNNQLKIAEYCYYKEKILDLIMVLDCHIFLYKSQEIDPKIFATLIDRSAIKWLWEKLTSKEGLNWRKNMEDIKELINQINEDSLSRKPRKQ